MSGHTPGPWVVEDETKIRTTPGSLYVAEAQYRNDQEEMKANAFMLAAAPELYDAAVWVLHNAHGISKSGDDGVSPEEESASWDALMAATAKAEGR